MPTLIWDSGQTWDGGAVWGGAETTPVYSLRIDLDRDETYAPLNVHAELSRYVERVHCAYGMTDSFDEVAPPARMTVTLNNTSGVFFPENANSPYFGLLGPGALVRLRASYQGVHHALFIGRLKRLEVSGANDEHKQATLTVEDIVPELTDAEAAPALMQNVTEAEALTAIFATNPVPWPYAAAPGSVTSLDTGLTTLNYFGDNAEPEERRGLNVAMLIKDLVAAGAGSRFAWNAKIGRFVYHNRLRDSAQPVSAVLDQSQLILDEQDYRYGDRLINALTGNYIPRSIGATGTVIFDYPGVPFRIVPGQTRTIKGRFMDPLNPDAQVGALVTIAPVAGLDYSATNDLAGVGANMNASVALVATSKAQFVEFTITNNASQDVYIHTLRQRGTPIYSYDRAQVSHEDSASILAYERQEAPPLQLHALDDAEFAESIVVATVNQYKAPFARLAAVRWVAEGDTLIAQALERSIGDKVTITVDYLNHDADYIIVGQEHTIVAGGAPAHTGHWVLYPASRRRFWTIEDPVYGAVDSVAVVAL